MQKQQILLVVVLVTVLLLQLLILLNLVHGNSATATSAGKCTGNSATATKLATARNIKLQGAVSGNANFDGGTNVTITTTQSNIAVLTGNITLPAANDESLTGQTHINYPAGFNRTNCVVLSIMGGKLQDDATLSTAISNCSSAGYLLGSGEIAATLGSDKITIRRNKVASTQPATTTKFKLVLLKIS